MLTAAQILATMGLEGREDMKVYEIHVEGSPFTEASKYATADIFVSQQDDKFYAATTGTISDEIAILVE